MIKNSIEKFISNNKIEDLYNMGFDRLILNRKKDIQLPTTFENHKTQSLYQTLNVIEDLINELGTSVYCARIVRSVVSNLENSKFGCNIKVNKEKVIIEQINKRCLPDIDIEIIVSRKKYKKVIKAVNEYLSRVENSEYSISILFLEKEKIIQFKSSNIDSIYLFEPIFRFAILGAFISTEKHFEKYNKLQKQYIKILLESFEEAYIREILKDYLMLYNNKYLVKDGVNKEICVDKNCYYGIEELAKSKYAHIDRIKIN